MLCAAIGTAYSPRSVMRNASVTSTADISLPSQFYQQLLITIFQQAMNFLVKSQLMSLLQYVMRDTIKSLQDLYSSIYMASQQLCDVISYKQTNNNSSELMKGLTGLHELFMVLDGFCLRTKDLFNELEVYNCEEHFDFAGEYNMPGSNITSVSIMQKKVCDSVEYSKTYKQNVDLFMDRMEVCQERQVYERVIRFDLDLEHKFPQQTTCPLCDDTFKFHERVGRCVECEKTYHDTCFTAWLNTSSHPNSCNSLVDRCFNFNTFDAWCNLTDVHEGHTSKATSPTDCMRDATEGTENDVT